MAALELASGWQTEVDRGPDWLFVRLRPPANRDMDSFPLAEQIWDLMRQHFATRVVLELDELPLLRSALIGQIVLLHKRVHSQGGIIRLSGVSDANQSVLRMMRLEDRFPQYRTRNEAVAGNAVDTLRFTKPR
jgi:anti-anti-sigma regulatory factor